MDFDKELLDEIINKYRKENSSLSNKEVENLKYKGHYTDTHKQSLGIQLNNQQEHVVQDAINWFNNESSELFEISGYAGTGKSVVLNEIVNRLDLMPWEILPMAYTGQATMVMRQKGFPNAQTCHSSLYNFVREKVGINEETGEGISTTFNTVKTVIRKIPKSISEFSSIKLIILDEAFMIPMEIKTDIDKLGIKVIAAGDNGQLPPVEGNPAYLAGNNIHYLTEIMRQNADSPLIVLADMARKGIPINPGLYGNKVLVMFDSEINNYMIRRANIVLCTTNYDKNNINNLVRKNILGIDTPFPVYGDRMICRRNNWDKSNNGFPLVNGMTGVVAFPPDISSRSKSSNTIDIQFAADRVPAYFDKIKINTKYLFGDEYTRKELRKNKFTKGELFDYAYASTVHLSQGSEYFNGIYLQGYIAKESERAMNYTAITRFKDSMIFAIHHPNYWQIPFNADIINMKKGEYNNNGY